MPLLTINHKQFTLLKHCITTLLILFLIHFSASLYFIPHRIRVAQHFATRFSFRCNVAIKRKISIAHRKHNVIKKVINVSTSRKTMLLGEKPKGLARISSGIYLPFNHFQLYCLKMCLPNVVYCGFNYNKKNSGTF